MKSLIMLTLVFVTLLLLHVSAADRIVAQAEKAADRNSNQFSVPAITSVKPIVDPIDSLAERNWEMEMVLSFIGLGASSIVLDYLLMQLSKPKGSRTNR